MSESFDPNSMDAQLATIIANQKAFKEVECEHHTEIMTKLETHDKRIGKLEREKAKLAGIMIGIGTASHWIWKLFGGGDGNPPSHH